MNINDGLPLVAPRVIPVLDPGFRPAVLAMRAFRALVDATAGAVPVGIALEQADGSVFHFETQVLPESHPQAAANVRLRRAASSSSCCGRAAAGGSTSTARNRWPRGWRRTTARPATGRFDAELRRRADLRPPAGSRAHARSAAGALRDQAARPPSRGLPHRLRSRRQRPQGRGGHRRPCRVQRRDRLGSVLQAGSAVSLRRHHGLAEKGGGASAARRRHRRQRRGRLREQPGQGGLALSGRAAGRRSTRA